MRKAIAVSAAVGVVLLSGCSSSSSATHATFASIPVSLAPTGSSINEESFTGTGAKTEPAVDFKGHKAWIYIACVSKEKEPSTDPKKGGVRVSVDGNVFGAASCSTDSDKSSSLISIATPLTKTISGPVKIETTKDTRWKVTLASGS